MIYTKNILLYGIIAFVGVSTHLYASESQVRTVSLDEKEYIIYEESVKGLEEAITRYGSIERVADLTEEEHRQILQCALAKDAHRSSTNSSTAPTTASTTATNSTTFDVGRGPEEIDDELYETE